MVRMLDIAIKMNTFSVKSMYVMLPVQWPAGSVLEAVTAAFAAAAAARRPGFERPTLNYYPTPTLDSVTKL